MPDTVPPMATPERLNDVLHRAGVIGNGRVRDVAVESSRSTLISRIVRLRVTYDDRAAGDAPAQLVLKTGLTDGPIWLTDHRKKEVAFYTQVAPVMTGHVVPRCFDAVWDESTKAWPLLLEDLTDTHVIVTTWPLPPSTEQCERIIDARARFHAAWWDDPRLGKSVGTLWDAAVVGGFLRDWMQQFARFADRLGDHLSRERRDLFERLFAAAPRLLPRYLTYRDLTIVQGDAHVWNHFYPRAPAHGDVVIFDWDAWRIDTATDDLAYMMGIHWYPERRRRLERPLLDRYH
jgi:hypothetical protein